MKISKEVRNGQLIPAWYGVAWFDACKDCAICLPMPINVIAAWLRTMWLWMKHGRNSVYLDPRDAFEQGFRHAYGRSIPYDAISITVRDAMESAVSRGANSLCMPDEYVEVCAWLQGVRK